MKSVKCKSQPANPLILRHLPMLLYILPEVINKNMYLAYYNTQKKPNGSRPTRPHTNPFDPFQNHSHFYAIYILLTDDYKSMEGHSISDLQCFYSLNF